ncbi:hypothetical protein B0O41_3965 [Propionibacteriaceae bacterium ES.041]|nr:hypothetical protein B0O41_3965 [Propionibacteriaceae bacterium ES.041]
MSIADYWFLRRPLDFEGVLSETQECVSWPPSDEDVVHIAQACRELIDALDGWETQTHGEPVVDTKRGRISTAEARRVLAREAALSPQGDIALLLVPAADRRVRVELRAEVDEPHGLLCQPQIILDWEQDGEEYEHFVELERKGPHWYMLSQLRDDMREGRLALDA